MATKRYDQFSAATPTGTRILLHADPSTGELKKCTLQDVLDLTVAPATMLKALQAAGSPVIAFSGNSIPPYNLGALGLANGTMYMNMVYLPACTITGIMFAMNITGYYTPINYNGAALYSVASGVLTKIASTTNDVTFFTSSANVQTQKAFSSAVAIAAGLYYVAFLSYLSTPTQLPVVFLNGGYASGAYMNWATPNKMNIAFTVTGKTSLPTTITPSSDFAAYTNLIAWALY